MHAPREFDKFGRATLATSRAPGAPAPMSRPLSIRYAFALLLGSSLCAACAPGEVPSGSDSEPRVRNVLFVVVDDLRPALGCYGDPLAVTPNIDRLAARSIVFDRAYCQSAICGPSRASFLTGMRPASTGVRNVNGRFRDALPDHLTLPQMFREAGCTSAGVGKVFHASFKRMRMQRLEDEVSWSVPWRTPPPVLYHSGAWSAADGDAHGGPAWEAPEVSDGECLDGRLADLAIDSLQDLGDEPFFLAVGFYKPHLPFVAPRAYFDLHPRDFPPAENPELPQRVGPCAPSTYDELGSYLGFEDAGGAVTESEQRELRRAYYACVSYVDAQIGRILDELDARGLSEDTAIVLVGDHGYHLQDNGCWCKGTNFEVATRVPLLISVPGMHTGGMRCEGLVELVDLYPTIAELVDLEPPAGLEGSSLVPLLVDPEGPARIAAYSEVRRITHGATARSFGGIPGRPEVVLGRSVRSPRWRYTEWRGEHNAFVVQELYDLEADPHCRANLAGDSEHATTVRRLRSLLDQEPVRAAEAASPG